MDDVTNRIASVTLMMALATSLVTGCSTAPPTGSDSAQSRAALQSSADESSWSAEKEQSSEAEAQALWDGMTIEQQVASLLILHFPGSDGAATAAFLEEFRPGGVILMGDNIPDPEGAPAEQTRQWQLEAESGGFPPLIVSIDQEGGLVKRLAGDTGVGAGDLRDGDSEAVAEAFRDRGGYLAKLGVNVNFGIVADYTDDPESFIYDRVLGTTPASAEVAVRAAVEGERQGGGGAVHSTIKHFPGHGLTAGDSHQIIPDCGDITKEEWTETAALPFEAGIDAGTSMVMMSHISCPQIASGPASLQAQWYGILRDDLGFNGVIVTDDMSMLTNSGDEAFADPGANAVGAINAGATLVLSIGGEDGPTATAYAQDLIDSVVEAVESGEIRTEVLHDAGIRALAFRLGLSY